MIGNFSFDLKSLTVFVTTVDSGNMTLAAEQLGTTQSSVSQSINNLEKALQAQLLDRTVRPIAVTNSGRFLYDSAQQILTQAQKTAQDMQHTHFNHLNHVNIAMVDSLVTPLAASLSTTLKKHTQTWSINSGLSHRHANALLSRNVDIIISDDAMEKHSDLMRYRILQEPFVLVLPSDFAGNTEHLPSLLNSLDFIRYNANSLIGIKVEEYLKRMGLDPRVGLRLDNTYAVLTAVAQGLGWTISTPLNLFHCNMDFNKIKCVPLPSEPLYRNLTLVCRDNQLWKLPEVIAKTSQQILQDNFSQYTQTHLPWLQEQISIT